MQLNDENVINNLKSTSQLDDALNNIKKELASVTIADQSSIRTIFQSLLVVNDTTKRRLIDEIVLEGRMDIIVRLTDLGFPFKTINPITGLYPIHYAGESNNTDLIIYFQNCPAIAKDQIQSLYLPTAHGWTLMHLAAFNGQKRLMEFLSLHLPFNITNLGGLTPMHCAAMGNHRNIMIFLNKEVPLNQRCSYDIKDYNGMTPKAYAHAKGHYDLVKFIAHVAKLGEINSQIQQVNPTLIRTTRTASSATSLLSAAKPQPITTPQNVPFLNEFEKCIQNLRDEMHKIIKAQSTLAQHRITELERENQTLRSKISVLTAENQILKNPNLAQQKKNSPPQRKRKEEVLEIGSSQPSGQLSEKKLVEEQKITTDKKLKTKKSSAAQSMKKQGVFKIRENTTPQREKATCSGTQPLRSDNAFLELNAASIAIKNEQDEKSYSTSTSSLKKI